MFFPALRVVFVGIVLTSLSSVVAPPRAVAFEPMDFEVERALGAEEDDDWIAQPKLVARDPDGGYWVYGASDCAVVRLDRDLRILHRFGTCGEGPGDLSGAQGLFTVDDHLWVVLRHRVSIHDRAGNFLDEISFAATPIASPVLVDSTLVAVAYPTFHRLIRFTPGRAAPAKVLFEGDWADPLRLFGRRPGEIFYVESMKGRLIRVPEDGGDVEVRRLEVEAGRVRRNSSRRVTTANWRSPVLGGWVDPESGIVVVTAEDNPAPSEAMLQRLLAGMDFPPLVVRRYDDRLERFRRHEIRPSGWPLVSATCLDDERILVLDQWGSRVALLKRKRPDRP